MKLAYTLIIIGTGQHHQGHSTGNPDRDADHHLKALVDRLEQTGQTITAAAFVVDGKAEMIIGKPEDLREVTPLDSPGVTLEMLSERLDELKNLLSMDAKNPGEVGSVGEGSETVPAVTLETVNETMTRVMEMLRALPAALEQTAKDLQTEWVNALKEFAQPKPLPKPESKPRGKKEKEGGAAGQQQPQLNQQSDQGGQEGGKTGDQEGQQQPSQEGDGAGGGTGSGGGNEQGEQQSQEKTQPDATGDEAAV